MLPSRMLQSYRTMEFKEPAISSPSSMSLSSHSKKSLHSWSQAEVIEAICSVHALVRNFSDRIKIIDTVHRHGITGAILDSGEISSTALNSMFETGLRRRKFLSQIKSWQKAHSEVIRVRTSEGQSMMIFGTREPVISLNDPVFAVKLLIKKKLNVRGVLRDSCGRHLVEWNSLKQNQLGWGDEIFVDLNPKQLAADIETSAEPDIITLEDDPEFPRARMRCGHAITPHSMTLHIADSLRRYQFEIFCPDLKCQCPWRWETVKHVAALTRREEREFEQQRRENEDSVYCVTKTCPNDDCRAPISRDRSIGHSRVRCPMCSQRDICWRCLRPWRSSEFVQCGNEGCDTQILASCNTRDMGENKDVPVVRCCPRCEQLVEHRQSCKHVHCPRCSLQFCMSCLKPRVVSGLEPRFVAPYGWQCGLHSSACPDGVAPRQCV